MRINHNIASLNTYRQLSANNANSSKSIEKLSSGLRINRAGDDAAGLAISEKMRAQIRGLDQASRNSQDAISLIQTAEGALSETHSILQRMRELAVQASNDTNTNTDREEIQKEVNQLTSEINRIGNATEFNTKKLLNGERANTLTEFTGNFGSASGASSATVTGLSGLSSVAFTGSDLSAGTQTLAISKTADSRTENVSGLTGVSDIALNGSSLSGDQNLIITKTAESRTVATSGSVGIANVTLNGAQVNSGSMELVISKTAENHADITPLSADATFSAGFLSSEVTFAGNKIEITDSGFTSGDIVISFNTASGTVSIKASGASGSVDDVVFLNANGSLDYDQFGIKFSVSNVQDSGSVTIDGTGGVGDYGTELVGYAGANAGDDAWMGTITIGTPASGSFSGANTLPNTNMQWTITLSGAAGANGFKISGVGDDGTTIQDVVTQDIGAGYTYGAYGLSFQISGGSGSAGDKVEFNTVPTYKWEATYNGSGTTTIASGASGGATISASGLAVGGANGITFSSTDISGTGTVYFDVAEAKQAYTYFAKLSGGADVAIASGVDSGTALNSTGFSGIAGIVFDAVNVSGTDSGTFSITNAVQTYTWKATLDGVASGVIATGLASGTAATATNFTGVSGISFSSSGLAVGSGNFTVFTEGSSGTDLSLAFQIGANENQSLNLDVSDMRASALGISVSGSGTAGFSASQNVTDGTNNTNTEYALDVSTVSGATASITTIDDAIKSVSQERSKLGAVQNRLEHTINNLGTAAENLTASESRIRDVDMAKEMMEFTKNNILTQAAQAMLAQANQQPQGVLQLLR